MKCWVASIPINLLSGESEQILLPASITEKSNLQLLE